MTNNKGLKGKGLKAVARAPKAPRIAKYGRRKGGNYPTVLQLQQGMQAYNTYANQPQGQQGQPQGQQMLQPVAPQAGQPQGQPVAPPIAGQPVAGQQGFIGTALTDLKNNKDMFQPVYDTTSTIGLFYNFVVALFATLLAALLIFVGYMVKDYYIKYTGRVRGKIVSAKCYTEIDNKQRKKKCDALIEYEVAGKKYKNNYISDDLVNINQGIDVNYEPANPNNFTTKYDTMSYIGWGLIIFAGVMLFVSWGWFILSWMFKPIAAASGIGAIGSALTPNS